MSGSEKRSNLTRRGLLKATGATVGAAALIGGGVLRALGPDEGAFAEEPEDQTKCRVGCCWTCVYCQYEAHVRDGKIVKLSPIEGGSPRGSRMCLRGRSRMRAVYNPNRILYPMKRAGERGEGNWERISWDEAISTIASKWKSYREEFGPRSIAYYWGSGNCAALGSGNFGGLLGRLANVLEMTMVDYCTDMALGYGMARVAGDGMFRNGASLIGNADKVVMWGCNFVDAWWQHWWPLADAMEKGSTRLIVVDPNYSTTASKANMWVSNRPGSDPALLLGIVNYIVENDLHNKEFLLNHSNASFLIRQDTKKILRASDLGILSKEKGDSSVENVSEILDSPIVWDEQSQTTVAYDAAVSPALSGERLVHGIPVKTAFDMLCDELGKYSLERTSELTEVSVDDIRKLAIEESEGEIWNIAGYASQAYDNGAEFGQALATLAILTGTVGRAGSCVGGSWYSFNTNPAFMAPTGTFVNTVPVLSMTDIMDSGQYAGEDYPIKSLFVAAANPMSSGGSSNEILEWWNKIDFIVVSDLQYSDSVKYADIVLPCAHALEVEDVLKGSYYPYVGITEKAVESPAEAKSDSDIARLISVEMGVGEYFEKTDEEYLRELVDESELGLERGITLDRLRVEKDICYDETDIKFYGGVFPTETGRANIYCETVVPRIDWGQELDPDFGHVPTFSLPNEAWPRGEVAKKYPFTLMSHRLRTRWHTGEFENEWMREIAPEPIVKINPSDAIARSIEDNSYVELFNERGHAVVRAIYADDIRPGVLIYPKGWQQCEFKEGGFSEMTSAHCNPFTVNTSFMDVAADIRPWGQGE